MRPLSRQQYTLSALFKLTTVIAFALGAMHLLGWPSVAETAYLAIPMAVIAVQLGFAIALFVKRPAAAAPGVVVGATLGSMLAIGMTGDMITASGIWVVLFFASLGGWLGGGVLALTRWPHTFLAMRLHRRRDMDFLTHPSVGRRTVDSLVAI